MINAWFCWALLSCGYSISSCEFSLPIFIGVASLALRQSYDCLRANDVALTNCITSLHENETKLWIKCIILVMYCKIKSYCIHFEQPSQRFCMFYWKFTNHNIDHDVYVPTGIWNYFPWMKTCNSIIILLKCVSNGGLIEKITLMIIQLLSA